MNKNKIYFWSFVIILLSWAVLFFRSSPPSPLYYVKEFRESLQSLFVFGSEDRAGWLLTLSDKRLEESQFLIDKNFNYMAGVQYKKANFYSSEAERLILSLKDKTNTTYLQDKFNANRQKSLEAGKFLK